MIPIKRRKILVREGVIFSTYIGEAKLKYEDRLLVLLKNVLYVLGLRVNLLSVRRLYKASLKGSLDSKKMSFKLGKEKILTTIIINGLYLISYIL